MKKFLSKPYLWAIFYSLLLTGCFTFVMLDSFVVEKAYAVVDSTTSTVVSTDATQTANEVSEASDAVITDSSYQDDEISITIKTIEEYDSTIYIADIQLEDPSLLKTALAGNIYGRNIKATTSEIAEIVNAIFAINGDYYGFRDDGYVLRNGVVYRDVARDSGDDQALVIDDDGNLSIISESEVSMDSLDTDNISQILSFGPGLIEDGEIIVDANSEVDKAMTSNPRTAIGQIEEGHYIVVVSDGRTDESAGLTLLQLATVMQDQGCTVAYNLDGGGSSTMIFNGVVINQPTSGKTIEEREVSDIVYIGY
ncbi:phosphodiester glycosidase family protein [Eubacteriaceae bacterium ES2]|nr:phosphodiester glycosidase family protein [Eubacteriaceae bacterium ES2]